MGTKKYSGWDNSCVCNGLCEYSHTVWAVKNEATINSDSQTHVPSPVVISLHAPDRTRHFTPECPVGHEKSSMADLTSTPELAMELEPEPTPAMDHMREPPPSTGPGPSNVSVLELYPEATSIPRPEPTIKSIPESAMWGQSFSEPVEELCSFTSSSAPGFLSVSLASPLTSRPMTPPWLCAPSALPWSDITLTPPGSLVPLATTRSLVPGLHFPTLWLHRVLPSFRLHLGPHPLWSHPVLPGLCPHLIQRLCPGLPGLQCRLSL